MRRSSLTLLALALLLGSHAASANMASVSGMRAKLFKKHPLLAQHMMPPAPPAVSGAPGSALTPTAVPAQCLSVAEVATSAGMFGTLLAAAEAAGLAPVLSDRSLQATIFAPTDDAFLAALETLDLTAEELLAQPDLLGAVLKYHVVPGAAITSAQMSDSQKLPTLLAADLAAATNATATPSFGLKKGGSPEGEDGILTLSVSKVYGLKTREVSRRITVVGTLSSAEVVQADIQAGCPAVVHVIDAVLLPDLAAEEEDDSMWESLMKIWGA